MGFKKKSGMNSLKPTYNITVISNYLNITWYTIDNGSTNYTFEGFFGTLNQSVWDLQSDGVIYLRFYANNSFGNFSDLTILIKKDTSIHHQPQIIGYDVYIILILTIFSFYLIIRNKYKLKLK